MPMSTIAYGDLVSAVLALGAAVGLRYGTPGALVVAWMVNVITSVDWVNATYLAVKYELASYPMGGNWYIINYYVPVIGVVHVMIFDLLLRRRAHADIPGPG
jgi:hypothetical protein